jgi:hypothetical protein
MQLIATACLYLACKVQEFPKYLRDVIKQAETKKWAKWQRDHPFEPNKLADVVRQIAAPTACSSSFCAIAVVMPYRRPVAVGVNANGPFPQQVCLPAMITHPAFG